VSLFNQKYNSCRRYCCAEPRFPLFLQAYTQRAIVFKSLGKTEQAVADFENGAKYGSKVAKIAAVKENPYAQMCNSIVAEVMKQYAPSHSNV
jgi:hypothetical protein